MQEITNITPDEREIELTHPGDDRPLGIHIQLQPMTAPKVKKVERRIRDEVLKIKSKGKALKSADVEANEIELITAAITGWRWEADAERNVEQPALNGEEKPEFNGANVRRLLKLDWAKEQIDDELGNVGDFFKN